jgi:hypothetical protein
MPLTQAFSSAVVDTWKKLASISKSSIRRIKSKRKTAKRQSPIYRRPGFEDEIKRFTGGDV